jgi:hypothetical protein
MASWKSHDVNGGFNGNIIEPVFRDFPLPCVMMQISFTTGVLTMVTSRLFSQNENQKITSPVLFKSFNDTETFRNHDKKTPQMDKAPVLHSHFDL